MPRIVHEWIRQATANRLVVNDRDGSVLVYVPPGEFEMGDGEGSDCPKHRVWLDGYYIGIYAVTNSQYKRFVEATGHRCPDVADFGEPVWRGKSFPEEKSSHPVVCVSWEDAKAYCEHCGLSLPTEAQWEYAARGGDGREHVWGNEWPPPAGAGNFADLTAKGKFPQWTVIAGYDDGYAETSPVGSFAANPYAVYDLAGNVWEWCGDWYDPNYYKVSPERNPSGPAGAVAYSFPFAGQTVMVGGSRVLRGGSRLQPPRRLSLC